MSVDYQGLGFNPNLVKSDSLLAQNRIRKTALEAQAEIVDTGYIPGDQILDGAVTQSKIGYQAVQGTHINNTQIDSNHLIGSSVDGTHIADGAISATSLAANSVAGSHIIDGGIGQADLAANSVYGTHIVNGEVGASEIAGSAILGTHIGTNTIAAISLQENSITALQIGTFDFSEGSGTIAATRITIGTSTQVQQIFDEDTLSSDSAVALATQQSIKAYVDSNSGGDILGVQIFS